MATYALTYHDGRTEDFETWDNAGFGIPIIHEPGKFEGEPVFVPYLYALAMESFSDESGDGYDAFRVDDELRAKFPAPREWAGIAWVLLTYSDQGFVSSEMLTERQFRDFEAECQRIAESESEDY